MNVETFLENFSQIANAPDGVSRLREVVLQLAGAGKLVSYDGGDADVADLFGRLNDARNEFELSANVRTKGLLPPVQVDEQTTEVPSHWNWIRLGNVCSKIGSGSTPRGGKKAYVNDGIPFLRSQNVWNEGLRLEDVAYIDDATHEQMRNTHVFPNDVLLNITGASLGRCALVPSDLVTANVSQHVTIIRPLIPETRRFIQLLLLAPFGQAMIWGRQVGMAREGLSKKVLELFEIPLPGLEEQKRIVEKVDELMKLCDELERQQQERSRLFPLLSRASHARLAAHPTPTNLAAIFTDPPTLSPDDMRQTIRALAVHGSLVSQDPRDGLGSQLIEQIAKHRSQLAKHKQLKRVPQIRDVDLSRCEFELPESWCWSRLGQVVLDFRYGTSRKCAYEPIGVPVLRIPNMKAGRIDSGDMKYSDLSVAELDDLNLSAGDLLFIRSNGSESLVGRCVVVHECDTSYAFAGYLVRARMPVDFVDPQYIQLAMDTEYVRRQIEFPIRTTSGVKNVNTSELADLTFPLPPLAEQRRIVHRVGHLMSFVDEIEAKQSKANKSAEAYARAAVTSITQSAS